MADSIKQGVKAPDSTTPTQIRIDKEQLAFLKLLAVVEKKTVAGIVRECIARYIDEKAGSEGQLFKTIAHQFPGTITRTFEESERIRDREQLKSEEELLQKVHKDK